MKSSAEIPNELICIGVLRALLLKLKGKPGWTLLMNMPVNPEPQFNKLSLAPKEYFPRVLATKQKVKAFIYQRCGFTRKFISEAELEKLLLVIKCNRLPCSQEFGTFKA